MEVEIDLPFDPAPCESSSMDMDQCAASPAQARLASRRRTQLVRAPICSAAHI
jgi:hypothetical protein